MSDNNDSDFEFEFEVAVPADATPAEEKALVDRAIDRKIDDMLGGFGL